MGELWLKFDYNWGCEPRRFIYDLKGPDKKVQKKNFTADYCTSCLCMRNNTERMQKSPQINPFSLIMYSVQVQGETLSSVHFFLSSFFAETV